MSFDASASSQAPDDTAPTRAATRDSLECDWCGQSVPREAAVPLRGDDVVICAECERGID